MFFFSDATGTLLIALVLPLFSILRLLKGES